MLDGSIVLITGAGNGLGRAEALEVARHGGAVVVSDTDADAAGEVAALIGDQGGRAMVAVGDCADTGFADATVERIVSQWGALDALVNNAGFLRDRTFVKMTPQEWDDVVRVHLRGHYAHTNAACRYWRDSGRAGRIVCTTSTAGLFGNFGQSNYGAAKAGIVAMSSIVAQEMSRYSVTSNVVAPAARTRMTAGAYGDIPAGVHGAFDFWAPENVAPIVAFLCSPLAGSISGKVFGVQGDAVELYDAPRSVAVIRNDERRWEPADLAARVPALFSESGMTPEVENMMTRLRFSMTDRTARRR